MKLLISQKDLINFKSRQPIPLRCYQCSKTFHKNKNDVQKVLAGLKSNALKFCSNTCKYKYSKSNIQLICKCCSKIFRVLPHDNKERKFCSISCSSRNRYVPRPTRKKRVPRIKRFCKCDAEIQYNNVSGMCKKCYVVSDQAMEQRGRTFSKTRKYKTNPKTEETFYLMSSLEEMFFDLCLKNEIDFKKPAILSYKDKNGRIHKYFPDFYLPNTKTFIEIKGFLTKEDKIKMDLVKDQHPSLNIKILFKQDIKDFQDIGLC